MAKKTIFIGNQSNDGTGDSIRDAFLKANQNFEELYSINGLGNGLFFTGLNDAPKQLIANAILTNDAFGSTVTQKLLVASTGIAIVTDGSHIRISNINSSLYTDPNPTLSANLIGGINDSTYFQAKHFADPTELTDLATMNYVNNNSFASSVNLYVSLSGNDSRTGSKAGRALAYAYRTVSKACQVAEALIQSTYLADGITPNIELGPDQKFITYGYVSTQYATIQSIADSTLIAGNKVIGVNYTADGTDPWRNNDIRPGQYIVGQSSGAIGFIEFLSNTGNGGGIESYDVVIKTPSVGGSPGKAFILGEALMYGSNVSKTNITIFVESGIYEEQLPIRVPANVSIRGDEFRRVLIRPAPRTGGRSTSPWTGVHFRRDTTFDGLSITTQPFGHHYLTDSSNGASLPKYNDEMDIFLLNDSTILRAISCQGHGGFMCVLDPEGQILTKSPYIQNCSSISKSINTQTFAGGMFIDGFVGNLQAIATDAVTYFEGTSTVTVTGLVREPQVPCAFTVLGVRYEVDYVENWSATNSLGNPAKLHLNPRNPGGVSAVGGTITVNSGSNYSTAPTVVFSVPSSPGGVTAQGTAHISLPGGVVTSITITNPGSGYTSAPTVTFVGGGTPSPAATLTLSNSIIKAGFIGQIPATFEIGTAGYRSALAADFTQLNDLGYGVIVTNLAFSELVSVFSYFCQVAYYAANGAQIGSSNGATKYGNYALKSAGSDPIEVPIPVTLIDSMLTTATVVSNLATSIGGGLYKNTINTTTDSTIYITNWDHVPYNQSVMDVNYNGALDAKGNPLKIISYSIANANTLTSTLVQVNLSTAGGLGTLLAPIPDGASVIIRGNKTFGFNGINRDNITRPSTAIDFNESSSISYHVLNYTQLNTGTASVTLKEPFSYIQMNPATFTSTSGTSLVHINRLATSAGVGTFISDETRMINAVNGSSSQNFIFGWNNRIHAITGYTPYTSTASITISPALSSDINITDVITLYAGLQKAQPAEITTRISLLRATGHDFVDTGAGGRETANIPNDIYGPPRQKPDQSHETVQVGKGRVFQTSTDQDGNFRVGDLFSINQGTGAATLSASITLSGIDALGFSKGVSVDEFSVNTTMNPASPHVVPTQSAVVGYIDSRLGITANSVGVTKAGPGFLDLSGVQPMSGTLQTNGNTIDLGINNVPGAISKIINLTTATNNFDATNKKYVDDGLALKLNLSGGTLTGDLLLSSHPAAGENAFKASTKQYVDKIKQVAALSDVTLTGVADTDFLMFGSALSINTTTSTPIWTAGNYVVNVTNSSTSAISVTRSANSVLFALRNSAVSDTHVAAAAEIAQSKLAMTLGTTRSSAPTGTAAAKQAASGLVSLDSALFTMTDGWATLTSPGNSKVLTTNASGVVTWSTFSAVAPTTISGNAATATALQTARTINGSSFDGTANITLDLINSLTRGSYLTGLNFNGSAATTWAVDVGTVTSADVSKVVARDSSGDIWFATGHGTATTALFADLAENYLPDTKYETGTVLVFGGTHEVTQSTIAMDRRVAGVVSAKPAYLMNSELTGGIAVALTGRVPCNVIGKIVKGDMLVTSGIAGVAMSSDDPKTGSVIGKALENYDSPNVGVIEVVVGRV